MLLKYSKNMTEVLPKQHLGVYYSVMPKWHSSFCLIVIYSFSPGARAGSESLRPTTLSTGIENAIPCPGVLSPTDL